MRQEPSPCASDDTCKRITYSLIVRNYLYNSRKPRRCTVSDGDSWKLVSGNVHLCARPWRNWAIFTVQYRSETRPEWLLQGNLLRSHTSNPEGREVRVVSPRAVGSVAVCAELSPLCWFLFVSRRSPAVYWPGSGGVSGCARYVCRKPVRQRI